MKVSRFFISNIYELIIVRFHLQMMSISISLTVLFTVPQEVVSVTVSAIMLITTGFNSNINYYKNVFAHKFYHYAYATSTFSFSALRIQIHMHN